MCARLGRSYQGARHDYYRRQEMLSAAHEHQDDVSVTYLRRSRYGSVDVDIGSAVIVLVSKAQACVVHAVSDSCAVLWDWHCFTLATSSKDGRHNLQDRQNTWRARAPHITSLYTITSHRVKCDRPGGKMGGTARQQAIDLYGQSASSRDDVGVM